MTHGTVKRPPAWHGHCDRCGWAGEWRDREWIAASDLVLHEVDWHGGAARPLSTD